jgi:hypothetical protein
MVKKDAPVVVVMRSRGTGVTVVENSGGGVVVADAPLVLEEDATGWPAGRSGSDSGCGKVTRCASYQSRVGMGQTGCAG